MIRIPKFVGLQFSMRPLAQWPHAPIAPTALGTSSSSEMVHGKMHGSKPWHGPKPSRFAIRPHRCEQDCGITATPCWQHHVCGSTMCDTWHHFALRAITWLAVGLVGIRAAPWGIGIRSEPHIRTMPHPAPSHRPQPSAGSHRLWQLVCRSPSS